MTLDPLLYDVQFDSETGEMSFYDKAGGLLYSCVVEREKEKEKPLTFEALEDGSTVALKGERVFFTVYQTSLDGGVTWNDYSVRTATRITLNTGEKVCFRVKAPRTTAQTYDEYVQFVMTGKISASGNCYSLITPDFKDVTDLTQVPDASGGTFSAKYGLRSLFSSCKSLTRAPVLPATTLAEYCCYKMFYGCTSLVKAPALPATTLARNCYNGMFEGCTSLVKAPALPATTLARSCYATMFQSCTSLVEAPVLPATTLAASCYNLMFQMSSALSKVTCYATDRSTSNCTTAWLNYVSATGDFYADPSTAWSAGSDGIPFGWTRHDIAELEA